MLNFLVNSIIHLNFHLRLLNTNPKYQLNIFRNHESEVEDAFRCFDRKGEGVVTRQELGFIFQVSIYSICNFSKYYIHCLQNLGGGVDLTEDEIESLLIEVDAL